MVSKITYKNVDDDCKIVYAENLADKGESWKTIPLTQLNDKLEEEFMEWSDIGNLGEDVCLTKEEYKELMDLILVSKMLCERYIDMINKSGTLQKKKH